MVTLSRFEISLVVLSCFVIIAGVLASFILVSNLHSHLEHIKELVTVNTNMVQKNREMVEHIDQNLERNVSLVNSTFAIITRELQEDDIMQDQTTHFPNKTFLPQWMIEQIKN